MEIEKDGGSQDLVEIYFPFIGEDFFIWRENNELERRYLKERTRLW